MTTTVIIYMNKIEGVLKHNTTIVLIAEPRRSDAVSMQLVQQTVQAQTQPRSSREAAHRGQAIPLLEM